MHECSRAPVHRDGRSAAGLVGSGLALLPSASKARPPIDRLVSIGTWRPSVGVAPAGLELTGISCPSSRFCMGVGDTYGPGAANDTTPGYAAYLWNGSVWSDSPYPGAAVAKGLSTDGWRDSVSCVAKAMCLVAYTGTPPLHAGDIREFGYGVIEWSGSAWKNTSFPDPTDQLAGLQCVSARWCMAVIDPGQDMTNGGRAMSAVWNGHSWTTQNIGTLDVPGDTPLALSCPTTTFCMTTTNAYGEIMDSALSPTQENASYQ